MMTNFFVTQDPSKEGKAGYFYVPEDSRNSQDAINSAIEAAGAVATADNPATVYIEGGLYYISDHIWFTPYSNPIRSLSTQVAPKYPCRYVTLSGIDIPTIKISEGLDPNRWGGVNSYDRLGMLFFFGASDVTVEGLILDGSYADLYQGKSTFKYGQSIMDAVVLYKSSNIKFQSVMIFNGACDGFLISKSSGFTAEDCVINYCGHDAFQCYSSSNVLVDRCRVGIRSNCGFRWAGDSNNGEIRNSEFWTALGGAAGFELQNAASNLKIHNNYLHNITGNGYGAIGYKGQSPTGSGHEYYNNIIVDCAYGISDNVPSTAVIKNNVVLRCSLTSKGTQSGNITSTTGYVIERTGTDYRCNTNFTVSKVGGSEKVLVGIEPEVVVPEPASLSRKVFVDSTGNSAVIMLENITPELLDTVLAYIDTLRI